MNFLRSFPLAPVQRRLHQLLQRDVILAKDVVGEDAMEKISAMKCCDVVLLENLRFEKGETKNDEALSAALASMADVYVNDAFGVSHRAHSSVEGITKHFDENSMAAGFLLQKEIKFFGALIKRPVRPFISVVGGSKVSGKLEALSNLLPRVDKMIIGGGMAFTFLKAQGYDVGNSLVEDDLIDDALRIMQEAPRTWRKTLFTSRRGSSANFFSRFCHKNYNSSRNSSRMDGTGYWSSYGSTVP